MIDPKKAKYDELVKGGMKPSEAIRETDAEYGEGHYTEKTIPKKEYKKEFNKKSEKEFVKPRIFKNSEDVDKYLSSLPTKERFEQEARLKGFKSGAERAKAIEYVNREMIQKADIEVAKERYGKPQEVYTETKEKLISGAKKLGKDIKKVALQASGIKDRKPLLKNIKIKARNVAEGAIGSAIIALKKKEPGDIRTLPKIRKELEKERLKEIAEKNAQRQHELAVAAAYGGHPQYKQKPRPQATLASRMGVQKTGGFMSGMSGFSLSSPRGTPVARPTQRNIARQPQVVQRPSADPFGMSGMFGGGKAPQTTIRTAIKAQIRPVKVQVRPSGTYHPSNNPEGYNTLFGNMGSRPTQRRVEPVRSTKPQVKRTTNPVSSTSSNFLVNMGGSGNFGRVVTPTGIPAKRVKKFWEA